MTSDVRERAKDALRVELAREMFDLFAAKGFDGVTVEDAARGAGISRATFFRYFGSKEEAVVAAVQPARPDVAATLEQLPGIPGETAWQLLRRAFQVTADKADSEGEKLRERVRLVLANPSLRAHLSERRRDQQTEVADALAARIGDAATAAVLAAAGYAATDLVWGQWGAGTEASFTDLLDDAFAKLSLGTQPL